MTYFYDPDTMPAKAFAANMTTSAGALIKGDKLQVAVVHKARASGSQKHRHPDVEQFNYVIKGHLRAWVEGEEKVVGPGGIIHIPANALHSIVATPEEDVIFFMAKSAGDVVGEVDPEAPSGPRYIADQDRAD